MKTTHTFTSELAARRFMAKLPRGSYTYWHASVSHHEVTVKA